MTDPIIKLRRSRAAVFCAALVGFGWGLPAAAANLPKVPVVHHVGILPVQMETGGDSYDLQQIQDKLDQAFPKVARDAMRFRILNDDLVRGLWSTAAGRSELRGQFELQGYLSLTMVPRADTVTIACRLLGPDLQNYLLETELYQASWLLSAPTEAVRIKLEELVFRLINRLPHDVSITSVQGPYITLSGGDEQGIEPDDRVSLIRSSIKSLHPANGSWVGFKTEPLGEAKIVEVKTHTSVAKIVKLTFEGALAIGDGAKIPAIAGRVKFARMGQKDQFVESGNQDTILVPPLYQGDPPQQNPAIVQVPTQPDPASPSPESSDSVVTESPKPIPTVPETEEGSVWDDFSLEGGSDKIVDDLIVAVGPHWWNTKGRSGVPASSKFPIWLINNFEVSVTRAMLQKVRVGFGGGGAFGSTSNGKFFSYDSHAKIYWREDVAPGDLLGHWEAGGVGRFSGMSVEGESFGGGDFIRGGGFGGIGGTLAFGEGRQAFEWSSQLDLLPLNVGRFGYKGSQKRVESTFGWQIALSVFQATGAPLEFGGRFRLLSETMTLSDNSRPQLNQHYLEALLRFSL